MRVVQDLAISVSSVHRLTPYFNNYVLAFSRKIIWPLKMLAKMQKYCVGLLSAVSE